MVDISVQHIDETYIRIIAEKQYLRQLSSHFTYWANGYKFSPKYKAGLWDGKIKLLNRDQTIYKGLLPDIVTFCESENLTIDIDSEIFESLPTQHFTKEQVSTFYKKIKGIFKPHRAQIEGVQHCLNNGRAIVLASTNAGKSYMMYGLINYHFMNKHKTLLIIDRSQLVLQLKKNISEEYQGHKRFKTATIYEDKEDVEEADVVITTWQSVYNNPDKWFKQFDVIIGDELHKFKANSLKMIMEKCNHIKYRYGFTATLDNDCVSDRLIIIGMFGTPLRVSTPQSDIAEGISSKPIIYAIILKYNRKSRLYVDKQDFPNESKFIEQHEARNDFIKKLDQNMKGNTLITFKHDSHGKLLYENIKEHRDVVYFINHRVKKEKRVEICELIDLSNEATGVVSLGTTSTGISVKNVNNIIIASQIKSDITIPQLIGRGMRLKTNRKDDTVNIFDIGDDLSLDGKQNIFYKHFLIRLERYRKDGYKIIFKHIQID